MNLWKFAENNSKTSIEFVEETTTLQARRHSEFIRAPPLA